MNNHLFLPELDDDLHCVKEGGFMLAFHPLAGVVNLSVPRGTVPRHPVPCKTTLQTLTQ